MITQKDINKILGKKQDVKQSKFGFDNGIQDLGVGIPTKSKKKKLAKEKAINIIEE